MPQNILLTVDAVIFNRASEPQVLLIQRKNPPYKGQWALPGGFVEKDEDLAIAAKRELQEETGLKVKNLKQVGTFGQPGRDPRGRTVSVLYSGILENTDAHLEAATDASAVQWWPLSGLPELAFDHAEIIEAAWQAVNF